MLTTDVNGVLSIPDIDNPNAPVPITATFGLHESLYAILFAQCSRDTAGCWALIEAVVYHRVGLCYDMFRAARRTV